MVFLARRKKIGISFLGFSGALLIKNSLIGFPIVWPLCVQCLSFCYPNGQIYVKGGMI